MGNISYSAAQSMHAHLSLVLRRTRYIKSIMSRFNSDHNVARRAVRILESAYAVTQSMCHGSLFMDSSCTESAMSEQMLPLKALSQSHAFVHSLYAVAGVWATKMNALAPAVR